jgi:hypothetical protein
MIIQNHLPINARSLPLYKRGAGHHGSRPEEVMSFSTGQPGTSPMQCGPSGVRLNPHCLGRLKGGPKVQVVPRNSSEAYERGASRSNRPATWQIGFVLPWKTGQGTILTNVITTTYGPKRIGFVRHLLGSRRRGFRAGLGRGMGFRHGTCHHNWRYHCSPPDQCSRIKRSGNADRGSHREE